MSALGVQVKLLDPSQQGDRLPKHLGVQELTEADLLIKVLLPNFSDWPMRIQEATLQTVVNNWFRLKHSQELCRVLSETKFVVTGIDKRTFLVLDFNTSMNGNQDA